MKNFFLVSICILFTNITFSQSLSDTIDLDYVLKEYPQKVSYLFDNVNLDAKGLEKVKKYVEKKQLKKACVELGNYYKQSKTNLLFEKSTEELSEDFMKKVNNMLLDTFHFQNISAKHKRLKNGRFDWAYRGPNNDKEWGYAFNRHHHLADLTKAFNQTGRSEYARTINNHLLDWILSNPTPNVNKPDGVQWRVLEPGLRLKNWPGIFYGLQGTDLFTPACKILMLVSIFEHAGYLKKFHWKLHNHALMEMDGLNNIAMFWPEYKYADDTHKYCVETMLDELDYQVLPDGVQNELSFIYHWVALNYFQRFIEHSAKGNKKLPDIFIEKVGNMYNYLAYALKPDGYGPLTGDSDMKNYKDIILDAAEFFNRPDWVYIVSNGEEGTKPNETSIAFPYAGHVILRNGWDKNAHWSFFDVGPAGASHIHNDKLNILVSAFGKDFLVDAGRYWYRNDMWRQYFINSFSHNTIIVDNQSQKEDIPVYKSDDEFHYDINSGYSAASDTYDKGYWGVEDSITHTRTMFYVNNKFWLVVDRVETNKQHNIQTLWHFHPERNVLSNNEYIYTKDSSKGNLLLKPIGNVNWNADIVKGVEKYRDTSFYRAWNTHKIDNFPIQGWYGETYNVKKPCPTAVYSTDIQQTSTFAWLLYPYEGERPAGISANIQQTGKQHCLINVELNAVKYEFSVDTKNNRFLLKK